ncbi:unnamed protein product, partial [marine sediment metagenome]
MNAIPNQQIVINVPRPFLGQHIKVSISDTSYEVTRIHSILGRFIDQAFIKPVNMPDVGESALVIVSNKWQVYGLFTPHDVTFLPIPTHRREIGGNLMVETRPSPVDFEGYSPATTASPVCAKETVFFDDNPSNFKDSYKCPCVSTVNVDAGTPRRTIEGKIFTDQDTYLRYLNTLSEGGKEYGLSRGMTKYDPVSGISMETMDRYIRALDISPNRFQSFVFDWDQTL